MISFLVTVLICGHDCTEYAFTVSAPRSYCEHAVVLDLTRIVLQPSERIARWTCEAK